MKTIKHMFEEAVLNPAMLCKPAWSAVYRTLHEWLTMATTPDQVNKLMNSEWKIKGEDRNPRTWIVGVNKAGKIVDIGAEPDLERIMVKEVIS